MYKKEDGRASTEAAQPLFLFKIECTSYSSYLGVWKESLAAWKENNSMMFNLIKHHCPQSPQDKLKTLSAYEAAYTSQNAISLVQITRDITHKQDYSKKGVMSPVETF